MVKNIEFSLQVIIWLSKPTKSLAAASPNKSACQKTQWPFPSNRNKTTDFSKVDLERTSPRQPRYIAFISHSMRVNTRGDGFPSAQSRGSPIQNDPWRPRGGSEWIVHCTYQLPSVKASTVILWCEQNEEFLFELEPRKPTKNIIDHSSFLTTIRVGRFAPGNPRETRSSVGCF